MAQQATKTRKRQRGAARRERTSGPQQLPWRAISNPFRPVEILSADQLETIHRASLKILEQMGLEIMSPEALDLLESAGAKVDRDSQIVRIGAELIEQALATAPSQVTLTPRNPAHAVTLGGDHVVFGLVAGPPNVHDMERGRRPANLDDYRDLLRLAQSLNIVHVVGNQPVPPIELPAETRHLDCYLANVTFTDRVYHCTAIGAERARDGIEMMALSRGVTLEQMIDEPGVLTIISVNSPRRFDGAMLDGLITMARLGQVVVVTPFTLMGAMTPVTLAAALAQQNAEALAGVLITQLARPGAPVVYGAFTSNVDLRSGAPAFGTPENAQATMAAGQLARRYGLPYRSSNANASNLVDAQAAYESEMSLWSSLMGGANLIYHGAGWLEGGLTASFEKVVLDAELMQMMAETMTPLQVDEASLALETIGEIDPGGHFFGTQHTIDRYQSAFYEPMLSDWRNYEAWEEAGGLSATQRATAVWKQLLADYQAPALDPAVAEALEAFVARRKEEIARDGLEA
ncbi:MAG: trimethylamine methyltransferase family protein [Pseudomonadota bacterium]